MPPTQEPPPTAAGRIARAARRRWRPAALLFVAALGLVAAAAALAPRTYRSQAKLFLRLGRENATLDPTATLGDNAVVSVPVSRENELNSVLEVLKSQVLLERVADRIGPAVILGKEPYQPADPQTTPPAPAAPSRTIDDRYRAVAALGRGLVVDAIRKSNVIQIGYDGPSPDVSRAVVAALVELYLHEHARINRTPGAHEFLAEQTARQRADLAKAEDALRQAKEETGLIAPDAQRQALVERAGKAEAELAAVAATTASTEAEIAALKAKVAALPPTVVTAATKGHPNMAADTMRAQFYALQVKELELRAKYPETHPELALVRKQVAAAEALLAKEEAAREQVTTGPNPARQDAELALARQEAALAGLRARGTALAAQTRQDRDRLTALGRDQMRVARLQREAEVHDARYRQLVANLERAQVDRALEAEKISNVSVVQPATFDPKPVKPNTLLVLALGLVVAAGGAVGLAALLDYRATRPAAGRVVEPLAVALATTGRAFAHNGHPVTEDATR